MADEAMVRDDLARDMALEGNMSDIIVQALEYLESNKSEQDELIRDLVREVERMRSHAKAPRGYTEIARIDIGPMEIGKSSLILSYNEEKDFVHAALWDNDGYFEVCSLNYSVPYRRDE
jgi:hypothetical protein